MTRRHPASAVRERGLSLIEILIALAIGSLLVLGLVEVFAASRTAYQLSTGVARVQENGRFAMDFLQRDLRMAGHMGCVNDQARFLPENTTGTRLALASTFVPAATPDDYDAVDHTALRFDLGIVGYEASGTASGDTVDLTTAPTAAGAATDWSPAIPADVYADMGNAVADSDVVVLRYFSPVGAQVTGFDPAAVPVSITFDPAQGAPLGEGVTNPGLFGISDCMNAGVFQATNFNAGAGSISISATGLNNDTLTGNESFVAGQANVYRAESIVLYVGVNGQGNPALFRLRYTAAPGAGAVTAIPEELVEGVESIQLQYGQDSATDVGSRPTGNIGGSRIASELLPAGNPVEAWRRVGLVQIGLVIRSSEPAAAFQREEDAGAGVTRLSALGVVVQAPQDTYYRAVYEDSIALRNRLFGN